MNYKLKCVSCNLEHLEVQSYTKCIKCCDSLEVVYDYELISERLNKHMLKIAPIKAIKYLDFYPLKSLQNVISLDEGGTPLYHCKNLGKKLGMSKLYIKNEGANPTGAFKDRGTMVEVTKAIELKKGNICCASTGNMAASVAAYSTKARIPCYVLVPEGTPIGKLSQTLSYGARIIQIRGSYDEAARLTEKLSNEDNYYLAGDYAYRLEGQKSQAFEIAEQLGWHSPDKVFVPVGCGTNSAAIYKGFKEFHNFDLINSTPSLVAVQAEGSSPIVDAFQNNQSKWDVIKNPQTVASAMCVGDPLDGTKILNALKESNGLASKVNDGQILEAEKLLAKEESVFVEPSAAATLASLIMLLNDGSIDKSEEVVLVLTGAGLKDPISALKVLPSPPTAEPIFEDIKKFLNYGYYKIHADSNTRKEYLFKTIPTGTKLKEIIKQKFDLELSSQDLTSCVQHLNAFEEKGKTVSEYDMRLILKNILNRAVIPSSALKILDFDIKSTKHGKPSGFIKAKYLGKEITETAEGVGPVDAIINAITKSLSSNGFNFKLTDYNVAIATNGTDAVVDVKMTLMDENKNKVIAVGTSPDIIVASIDAFEQGYNILHMKNNNNG